MERLDAVGSDRHDRVLAAPHARKQLEDGGARERHVDGDHRDQIGLRSLQSRDDASERPGFRNDIRYLGDPQRPKAAAVSGRDEYGVAGGPQHAQDPLGERLPVELDQRLVRAHAAAPPAGEDHAGHLAISHKFILVRWISVCGADTTTVGPTKEAT